MVHAGAVGTQPDRVTVVFDDERAVADAGVVLPATLAARLGVGALVDEAVDLGDRPGAANAGAKVMTLISAMAPSADCIDDCDLLRAGRYVGSAMCSLRRSWGSVTLEMAAAGRAVRRDVRGCVPFRVLQPPCSAL